MRDELGAAGVGVLSIAARCLVGREQELAELCGSLGNPAVRVTTVTGPAGVGKSRLAVAAFAEMSRTFEDGGRVVDVGEFRPGQDPETALAEALGLEPDAARPARTALRRCFEPRHSLLVLDGCDRLRPALAPVVARLINDCPRLTVLATGLERLGVYGEALLRLSPLALPPEDGTESDLAALREVASVRLFVDRTAVSRPRFTLTDENREAVVRLCRRTDGLPIAIEFAAARMKMLSPQRLLDELADGLDALSGTEFDTLSRHRGMRTALARGLDVLDPAERGLLRRLAVFHRPFDVPTAESVWPGEPADFRRLLEALVDKSLLHTEERSDGELALAMLGLTRQFLLDEAHALGEADLLGAEHAAFCIRLAESAESGLRGPGQARLLDRLDHWREDLSGALRFLSGTGDLAGVVRIAASLHLYWQARGAVHEGIGWLRTALRGVGLTLAQQAKAHLALGELLLCTGELTTAEDCLAMARGAFEELGDHVGVASCMRRSGLIALHRGDLVEADRRLEECAAVAWVDREGEHAEVLRNLADARRAEGDAHGARRIALEALAIFEQQQDIRNVALTRLVLADAAFALGDQDGAVDLYRSALPDIAALKHLTLCPLGLEKFTILLARARGRSTETWRRVARAVGAAAAVRSATGCVAPARLRMEMEAVAALTRVRLGDEDAETLAAEGSNAAPEAAVLAVLTPQCAGTDRDPGTAHPLTPREREVAELVASGLTNREIARRLGIAEWTAVNHVRKIMRKLACTSRVQVASWTAARRADGPTRAA
ncbi:LuxR C-terminal-related transcriptional regulator [Streptomyces sp. LHD-70]|uniref:ATP-binding protein n=1 Tax=Streptomyces sp. LHD-70 TaxID=3072140 RepID=UPI00280C7344|nr:LuxR C-terminal-related transcriptional regulator [Streptomyces sp. LHD-70]MDQ8707285.1 LuxR C-terminal-related transcriptional regulator [Streptomyces sp. LHD-70]